MRTLYIKITDDQERAYLDTVCGKVQAIAHLQAVIERLRAEAAPTVDCSWGEQPMPVLGPSSGELSALPGLASPTPLFPAAAAAASSN